MYTITLSIIGLSGLIGLGLIIYTPFYLRKCRHDKLRQFHKNVEHFNKASDYLAMYEATMNKEYLECSHKELEKIKYL